MLRKTILTILYILFIPLLTAYAWMAYSAACTGERETRELTDRLHAKPRAKTLLKKAGEIITLGLYKGYSEEIDALNSILMAIKHSEQRAIQGSITFFLIAGVFLVFVHLSFANRRFLVAAMLIISLMALMVGLFAPILSIVTYKEVPVLGRLVFLFQSKGIITTIETLFTSGNVIVAIPLALFSLLIPFLKTLVMGIALFGHARSSRSLRIIRHIGKWSMADVFVVTMLLTYFTVNKDKATHAEVQIGLYFFLGYVILSMIASHMLAKSAD